MRKTFVLLSTANFCLANATFKPETLKFELQDVFGFSEEPADMLSLNHIEVKQKPNSP
jgi:hypothetical protein